MAKIVNRTKEQIKTDLENARKMEEMKVEAAAHRKFVKEKFYPFLLENSEDVKDTLSSLQFISSEINAAFNEKMIEKQKSLSESTLSELNLLDRKFFKDSLANQHNNRDSAIIELFKDTKTNVASSLIAGMVNEIKFFLEKKYVGRSLNTIQTDFLDENPTEKKESKKKSK
jgi:hypothetical protein